MRYFSYDDFGVYTGSGNAAPGDIPGSWLFPGTATTDAPPTDEPGAWRWTGAAWVEAPVISPAERRRVAYEREADGYRDAALSYFLEASALEAEGDEDGSMDTLRRMKALLADYLRAKREIRERYPDRRCAAAGLGPGRIDAGAKVV